MVATLISLKNRQYKNYLRKSTAVMVSSIIMYLYLLGILGGAYFASITALLYGGMEYEKYSVIGVAVPVAIFVLIILISALNFSGGTGLNPESFKLLFSPSKKFARQILMAEFVGIKTIGILLILFAVSLPMVFYPSLFASYLLGILFFIVTFHYSSKIFLFLIGGNEKDGNKKSQKQLLVFLVIFIPYFYFIFFMDEISISIETLYKVIDFIQWVPFFASVSFPFSLYEGNFLKFGIQLLIAIATIFFLDYLYCKMFLKTLEEKTISKPKDTFKAKKDKKGIQNRIFDNYELFRKLGLCHDKASMLSRVKVYWEKDTRYSGNIIFVVVIPIFCFIGVYQGFMAPESIMNGSLIVAFLLGYSYHVDISADSTAFATQIMCGVKGKTDRFARAIPYIVVTLLLIFIQVCLEIYFGVSFAVFCISVLIPVLVLFIAISVNSVIGTKVIYPIQVPNSSIFEQKGVSNMGLVMLTQLLGMGISGIFAIPIFALLIFLIFTNYVLGTIAILGIVGAILYTVIITYIAYRISAKNYDKNKYRFMEKISSWPDHKIKIL